MQNAMLEKIEKDAESLSLQDQLKLMEILVRYVRKKGVIEKSKADWMKLYGMGKGLWNGKDAQDYVDGLRKERL